MANIEYAVDSQFEKPEPAPGDYDGDGRADPTVLRPSNNTWFKLQSTSGFDAITFGASGDIPVPSAFVR